MQYATWRPVLAFSLLAAALSPLALAHRAPRPLTSGAKIVELHGSALTDYLPGQAVAVQDIRPQPLQRGTQIDGVLRAAPSQRMAIQGNPFENAWRAPRI